MNKPSIEFLLLYYMVDYLESKGVTYKLAMFAIDEEMVNDINNSHSTSYSVDELQKAADLCFSHEWINHVTLDGKYSGLGITPKGVGAARSKRKADELKANRSLMKKASDYIEDHKGLFIFLGFLIGLVTLSTKFIGE